MSNEALDGKLHYCCECEFAELQELDRYTCTKYMVTVRTDVNGTYRDCWKKRKEKDTSYHTWDWSR